MQLGRTVCLQSLFLQTAVHTVCFWPPPQRDLLWPQGCHWLRLAGDESFAERGFVPLLKLGAAQERFPGLTEVRCKCKDVSHVAPPGLSVEFGRRLCLTRGAERIRNTDPILNRMPLSVGEEGKLAC